jgi:hypothetical protein
VWDDAHGSAKALNIDSSGDDTIQVVSFRRGDWEQRLLDSAKAPLAKKRGGAARKVPPDTPRIQARPPSVPRLGPASAFVRIFSGFEVSAQVPEEDERDDNTQKVLHSRLIRRVKRLNGLIERINNTQPALAAEFHDYAIFVSRDLDDLDVVSLWSAGSGLSEFVRSLDAPQALDSITPSLEPEVWRNCELWLSITRRSSRLCARA